MARKSTFVSSSFTESIVRGFSKGGSVSPSQGGTFVRNAESIQRRFRGSGQKRTKSIPKMVSIPSSPFLSVSLRCTIALSSFSFLEFCGKNYPKSSKFATTCRSLAQTVSVRSEHRRLHNRARGHPSFGDGTAASGVARLLILLSRLHTERKRAASRGISSSFLLDLCCSRGDEGDVLLSFVLFTLIFLRKPHMCEEAWEF